MSNLVERYLCRGKPGLYEKLGVSKGAGLRANERLVVYRCVNTGTIYHREIRDFDARMTPILDDAALDAELERILDNPSPPSKEMLEILELDSEGGHCD